MTPKEKAHELVAKHFQIVAKAAGHKGLKTIEDTHVFTKLEKLSKGLAQLTVLEIIDTSTLEFMTIQVPLQKHLYEYWQKVQKEIELL